MSNVMKIDFKQTLGDIANRVKSIETKAKKDIREIPLNQIRYNPKNRFGIRDIEKLSESIKEYGQLHNAVVRVINDDTAYKFELISGERRHRALTLLGAENILAMVIEVSDDEVAEAMLIITNLETREVSDLERSENAIRLAQIVESKRKSGEDFKGKKTREVVAEMMSTENNKVGASTVQMLLKVHELIQEFKDMLQNKEITLEKANQFAQMTQEQQKIVYEMFEQGKELTAGEAKELKERFKKDQESQSKIIEDMKKQVEAKDREKEGLLSKLKSLENEKKNTEESLNLIRKNLNEVIEQRNIQTKEIEKTKDSLRESIRAEIEDKVNKEDKEGKGKRIKELEDILVNTSINEKAVQKLYEDRINELQQELKAQEEKNKQKGIEEFNIKGNIEILTIGKQAQKLLRLLKSKMGECSSREGFEYTKEVEQFIDTMEMEIKFKG